MLEYLLLASEVVWGRSGSVIGTNIVTLRMGGLFFERLTGDSDDLILMRDATITEMAICDGLIIVRTSQGVHRYNEVDEVMVKCAVVNL